MALPFDQFLSLRCRHYAVQSPQPLMWRQIDQVKHKVIAQSPYPLAHLRPPFLHEPHIPHPPSPLVTPTSIHQAATTSDPSPHFPDLHLISGVG